MSKKLILVLGATGAQGLAVIDALLSPSGDGSPSLYAVRALTRDPNGHRAKSLQAKGVELVQGNTDDLASVEAALQGVYGAWINIDGFTVGEVKESYAGLRIFELAKQAGIRHYVWSNLDYGLKKGGYNQIYRCEHYDGKGRIAEWMKQQSSVVSDTDMSWSVVTTGPYMDMLSFIMFAPLGQRKDGAYVFAAPIGNGHVPMIALSDLGFWARWTFDHRAETSAKDLEIASDMVDWPYLVSAFTKATGHKAVFKSETLDEWFAHMRNTDRPVANQGIGSTTWKKNFSGWWSMFRDDICKRDMEWIMSINPHTRTVEKWMTEVNYDATVNRSLLKKGEEWSLDGIKRDMGSASSL
ncbi:hypothetical protein EWM64_g3162 [Hericium alpestre]|uniref:NmrA-like domain-containing protein n=1 Tax=Hericium alpestre TaxID=135208 RepID=A0A4Z0A322_9AGAM|nr:hypothetical protein EWM64_g3162 [Hericium alpestre]